VCGLAHVGPTSAQLGRARGLGLKAGDAGDVQQIIDQPGKVLDLAFDDIPGPPQVGVGRAEVLQDLDGIRDRGQGQGECAELLRVSG